MSAGIICFFARNDVASVQPSGTRAFAVLAKGPLRCAFHARRLTPGDPAVTIHNVGDNQQAGQIIVPVKITLQLVAKCFQLFVAEFVQGHRFQLGHGKSLVADAEHFLITIPDLLGR